MLICYCMQAKSHLADGLSYSQSVSQSDIQMNFLAIYGVRDYLTSVNLSSLGSGGGCNASEAR